MAAGLIAGAVGTLIAVLLSLPLYSPDDIFFNSLTVAIGGALTAVAAGIAWQAISRGTGGARLFTITVGTAFLGVAAAAMFGNQLFDRTASYTIPIAVSIFGSIAVLTPVLAKRSLPRLSGVAALVPALALGAVLVTQRDTQIIALTLPASMAASTATAAPTSAPATGGTAAVTATATSAAASTAAAGIRTAADVQGMAFAVGTGSQSQFTVREKLAALSLPNDATMHNTALKGTVHLDGRPSTVTIDLTAFTSDQSRRDSFIRTMFRAQPTATVTIDNIGGALPGSYTPGEVVKRTVSGKLSIQGADAPITLEVEARLEGAQLQLLGITSFRWADYNLRPPNVAGTVQVEDQVNARILLVATGAR